MVSATGCTQSDPGSGAPGDTTVTATPTSAGAGTPSASPSPTPSGAATAKPTPGTGTQAPSNSPATPTIPGASAFVSLATADPSGGGILVGGYVSGVLEDGGECTFTVTPTSGGATLTANTTGTADVNTTSCGSTTVPSSHTGTFDVVLTYRNSDGTATSAAVSVTIS